MEVMMMAIPRKQTYPLAVYLNKIRKGDIRMDAGVQRRFVWTKEQINELVVSVLRNEYIPPVILGETESQLHIADGGQRSSAWDQFRYGNYKITSSVEESLIPYKKERKDESGDVIWENAVFDIRNKTFGKLPEELKLQFDRYPVDTVIHEHCSWRRLSHYVKRYNSHTSMNADQKAFTCLDNYAGYVRNMLDTRFFLDHSVYTEAEKTRGVMERVIVETIMCSNFPEDWRSQPKASCRYLNSNATKKEFDTLADQLHRLEKVVTDDIRDLFNSRESVVFLTLFDRFTRLGLADIWFARFLREFKRDMRYTRRNRRGLLYDEIDKKASNEKDSILSKLELLGQMMEEYLSFP